MESFKINIRRRLSGLIVLARGDVTLRLRRARMDVAPATPERPRAMTLLRLELHAKLLNAYGLALQWA